MTLQKFLLVALVVFFVGIALLFAGVNRAPFRPAHPDSPNQHGHSSWLFQSPTEEPSEQQILAFK
jgi:hypothetical protein